MPVSSLTRAAVPIRLAGARLWSRRGRVALAGLATGAGAALLATMLAASVTVSDQTVARGIGAIPEQQRSLSATWGGLPAQEPRGGVATLSRMATRALTPLTGRAPSEFVLFRETHLGGALVDLSAGDHLGRWIRLRSGRLPHACVPGRCEVVQLAGSGPLPRGLVRVGSGSVRSQVPFGDLVDSRTAGTILSRAQRWHRPAAPPFVVAEGVSRAARLPGLVFDYRSYRWAVPLAPGDVHPWSNGSFERKLADARASLEVSRWPFAVESPDAQLASALATGRAGARRLLLLGGEAAALLLAFTILAATGLRRDAAASRRRLTWLGATRSQLVLQGGAEAAAIAALGAAVGWFLGIVPAVLIARHFGSPAGAVVGHSILSGGGILVAVSLAVAAAIILLASVWTKPVRIGGLHLSGLDIAAVGAAALIAVAFARGSANPGSLSSGTGTSAVLLLLPGLVVFVAGVVAARAVAILPRLLERASRRTPLSLRLATLSLARNPGRSAVAVAFLAVSLGLALFASVYRSTLLTGERQQAAYAVPAPAILSEDDLKLVPVLGAARPSEYRRYGGATGVIRLSGNVPSGRPFTVLALPASSVARVQGWRGDFSALSLSALGRRIAPHQNVALRGVPMPAGRLTLSLGATGLVRVRAAVETRRGNFEYVSIPGHVPPSRLLGFSFDVTNRGLEREAISGESAHKLGTLTLRLRAPAVNGSPLPVDYRAWTGTGGVRSRAGAESAVIRFLPTSDLQPVFRLRQPMDGRAVPVVVTPALAASAGPDRLLPIDIEGTSVVARVVGTTDRFPSVNGDAVLADRQALATAMNTTAPGTASVNEIWLGAEPPARPPFDLLRVQTQRAALNRLTGDPLARGSLLALIASALAGLGLALAGLLLVVVTDQRDERGELFDLEAQGATPGMLRLHLRLRAAIVVTLGLLFGAAAGAVLSALVVSLVKVTANATEAQPPLVLSVDWRVLGIGVALYVLAAALLVGAATWRAFSARSAGRFAEVGW
jgi:FtsX-like permease family protein